MNRKIFTLLFLISISLAGCGAQSTSSTGSSTTENIAVSSTTAASETTEDEAMMETSFTGVIQETPETSGQDPISIYLKDVQSLQDDEDIVASFESDGVILHVPAEAFTSDLTDFIEGAKVEVHLQGVPVMTMSIPPQIPGNSIKSVTVLAE